MKNSDLWFIFVSEYVFPTEFGNQTSQVPVDVRRGNALILIGDGMGAVTACVLCESVSDGCL